MRRLLSMRVSNHKESKEFYLRCLNHFADKTKLAIHEEYCLNYKAVKIEMPEEGCVIKFKNLNRLIRVPFIVYADFECINEPIHSCEPRDKSFTHQYQKHKPCGFCYHIKCFDSELYPSKTVGDI